MCNIFIYTNELTIFYYLYYLQIYSDDDIPQRKYYQNIDINSIKHNDNINYYCPVCIDVLIFYQKSTNEVCNSNNLINYLQSFNLEDTEVRDEEEIEILNIILSEVLES